MAKAPNPIKLKKSSVPGKVPLGTDLEHGELAINYADGKIFYKDTDDNIQEISGGGPAVGVFYVNEQVVLEDYTLPTGKSAISAGPITIDDLVTVEIETGARWVIV